MHQQQEKTSKLLVSIKKEIQLWFVQLTLSHYLKDLIPLVVQEKKCQIEWQKRLDK